MGQAGWLEFVIPALYWALVIFFWTKSLKHGGQDAWKAFFLFLATTSMTVLVNVPDIAVGSGLGTWGQFSPGLFAADAIYFAGLALIALKSNRYWPIWSAGFALVAVITHFGPLLDPFANAKLYRALASVWALPIMISMTMGIERDRRAGLT